jgi:hypothetical protein
VEQEVDGVEGADFVIPQERGESSVVRVRTATA